MKLNRTIINYLVILLTGAVVTSCVKDDSKLDYGNSLIYMPQAIVKSGGVDNKYPVPSGVDSSTLNYSIDSKNGRLNIILGTYVSGPSSDAYAVDIQVDNDTVQSLLNNKVLDPATYMLLPASMYTLPDKLEVAQGQRYGNFDLSVSIDQLKSSSYAGKFLVLAVKLANPTTFELNKKLSTTLVVLDVNALVIGPAVNITSQYIKNPGGPFVADGFMANSTRWGNLKDWKTNAAARSHGGFGGFNSDASGTMGLESGWGSPQILNGKLYQTITLPKGSYSFDLSPWNWQGTKDPAYIVVAPNVDDLPDYNNIVNNTSIWYALFSANKVNFELSSETKITLGVVVNYVQDQQGFKTQKVTLVTYPKHL